MSGLTYFGIRILNWDKNPMELDIFAQMPTLTSIAWLKVSVPGCKDPTRQTQQSQVKWPVQYSVSHVAKQTAPGIGGGKITYKESTSCLINMQHSYYLNDAGGSAAGLISIDPDDDNSNPLGLAGNQVAIANHSKLGEQGVGISMNGKLMGYTNLECSFNDNLIVTLTPTYFWRVAQYGLIDGEQVHADLFSYNNKVKFMQGNRFLTITVYVDPQTNIVQKKVQYGTGEFPRGLDANGTPL